MSSSSALCRRWARRRVPVGSRARQGESMTHDVEERLLFVYGTLLPGEERWTFLEPFVTSRSGDVDSVRGTLWDTGLGFPAFTRAGGNRVHGCVFELRSQR